MPHWTVGKHRKTLIVVRGLTYAVAEATPSNGGWQYVLTRWAPPPHELPGRIITYDDAYARDREMEARAFEASQRVRWVLLPLSPLLGFLPRVAKARLHERYGFEPRGLTAWSVRIEGAALLVELVLASISATTGVSFGGGPAVGAVVLLLGIPDFAVRVGVLLDDEFPPYGAYEWLAQSGWMARLKKHWHTRHTGRRR
jgi:hypothetical protein